eukprot:1359743-Rhodomonas_salina.1
MVFSEREGAGLQRRAREARNSPIERKSEEEIGTPCPASSVSQMRGASRREVALVLMPNAGELKFRARLASVQGRAEANSRWMSALAV